jgi:flagellar hook-associated protein 3 FlgL
LIVHYTQGAGTTIDVEIRQADDVSRATDDTFSFSNVMQMTDLLSSAITNNDKARLEALSDPFDALQTQVNAVQSDIGFRLGLMGDQNKILTKSTSYLNTTVGSIENADMAETGVQLQKIDTLLQALYASSSKLLSQSLFDFLK